MPLRNLDALFEPRSIGIIAESFEAGTHGALALQALASTKINVPVVLIGPAPPEKPFPAGRSTAEDAESPDLILQMSFGLTAVVSGGRFGLVLSSPERPGHDKAGSDWGPEQNTGQKVADLGHCRQKRRQAHQAAAGTPDSFRSLCPMSPDAGRRPTGPGRLPPPSTSSCAGATRARSAPRNGRDRDRPGRAQSTPQSSSAAPPRPPIRPARHQPAQRQNSRP